MTVLYGRKIKLLGVSNKSGEGLDISDLHVQFQVKQFDLSTPGSMDARVFNLSGATMRRFDKEFDRIVLQAGYGDLFGTIFDGTVVQTRRGRTNPADTYLDITGADGDWAHNFATVNTTLAAGSTPDNHYAEILRAMRIEPGYKTPLQGPALPRGKVMYGMARDYMRDVTDAAGATWNIRDGVLNVVPLDGYLPGEAVVLTSATGLIGLPEQTQEGIMVRCLLNPRIKPQTRVQINNASIQRARLPLDVEGQKNVAFLPKVNEADGMYRVLAVDHTGDTRGLSWYSELVCVSLDATSAAPGQVQRGRV